MNTITEQTSDALLRGALKANAAFSMVSGVVATVFAGPIAQFMGVPILAILVVGVGVAIFGVSILINARRKMVNLAEARLTVVSDAAWVIGAAVLILVFPDVMTTGGKMLLGGISIVVGVFAVLQWLGLRSMVSGE